MSPAAELTADAATAPTPPVLARTLVPHGVAPSGEATEMLYARLTADDLEAVEERLRDEHTGMWQNASEAERKRLTLALGLHYDIASVSEHTGLSPAVPPDEVHSMVHGWITETGGSYYLADMVLECLEATGEPLAAGAQALDFSCSSGRVVRPLAAAREDVHWHGCDPNADAIAWAGAHLPGIDFFVTGAAPPLAFDDGHFDFIFAISVWSHYKERAALRWLAESHRLIAPGGRLLLTTHGLQSCVWFTRVRDSAIESKLGTGWITDTASRLERNGHCFWDVFGEQGDWGVVDREWGLAFFTPEWLLENITPEWAVRSYRIGRAHENQDVYLLERR